VINIFVPNCNLNYTIYQVILDQTKGSARRSYVVHKTPVFVRPQNKNKVKI